jgi:hypothetical protein
MILIVEINFSLLICTFSTDIPAIFSGNISAFVHPKVPLASSTCESELHCRIPLSKLPEKTASRVSFSRWEKLQTGLILSR